MQHKSQLFAFCEQRTGFADNGHRIDIVCRRGDIKAEGVEWRLDIEKVVTGLTVMVNKTDIVVKSHKAERDDKAEIVEEEAR